MHIMLLLNQLLSLKIRIYQLLLLGNALLRTALMLGSLAALRIYIIQIHDPFHDSYTWQQHNQYLAQWLLSGARSNHINFLLHFQLSFMAAVDFLAKINGPAIVLLPRQGSEVSKPISFYFMKYHIAGFFQAITNGLSMNCIEIITPIR